MAKKAYVGVNGISKNVKNIYVGVNGVPKKVVKGYVGVNGVARLFWDGGTPPTPVIAGSWDFWSSVAGTTLFTIEYNGTPWSYQKANNMIAYYAIICVKPNVGNINYFPLFLSPVSTATSFQTVPSSSPHIYSGSVTDKMGISWRYASGETVFDVNRSSISPQGCLLNTIETYYTQNTEGIRQAALDLLDRIYSVPFHEDYQIGTRYKLGITDVRKTIRKVISTALYSGVLTKASDPAYIAFSDNADAIISNLMSVATSHIMELQVQAYSNIVNIYLFSTSMLETPYVQIDTDRGGGIITQNGYTYMLFSDDWQAGGLYPDFEYDVTVDENGNISYEYVDPFRDVDYRVGMHLDTSNNLIDTEMTNMGIDL